MTLRVFETTSYRALGKQVQSIIVLALLMNGCVTSPPEQPSPQFFPLEYTEAQRQLLLGKWKGTRESDGEKTIWLITRFPDGFYTNEFLVTDADGKTESWVEVGIWGIRKPIYFTAMRGYLENNVVAPADTSRASLYDAYQIVELNDQSFKYFSLTSGNTFSVSKVPDDYAMNPNEN